MKALIVPLALLVKVTLFVMQSGVSGEPTEAAKQKEKNKVVILTGDDFNHSSGTHEFQAGGILIKESIAKSVLADQVEVVLVNNWPEDTSVFSDADMIIHYYKGNKDHFVNSQTAFIDALASKGVSQMFIHYACDPGPSANTFLKKWTGGVYFEKDFQESVLDSRVCSGEAPD